MRGFVLAVVIVGAAASLTAQLAPDAYAGQWSGQVVSDKAAILKTAVSPEHRKLLNYAIMRMDTASVVLAVYPGGRVDLTFEDGYRPDRKSWRGSWDANDDGFHLHFRDRSEVVGETGPVLDLIPSPDKGARIEWIPGMPKGLSATFKLVRKNLPKSTAPGVGQPRRF